MKAISECMQKFMENSKTDMKQLAKLDKSHRLLPYE